MCKAKETDKAVKFMYELALHTSNKKWWLDGWFWLWITKRGYI